MNRQRRSLAAIIRRGVTLQTLMVIVVVLAAIGAIAVERSIAASERQDADTLLKLGSFEFQVLNAETGFRGYALSHRRPFLVPYKQAIPAIAALRPDLMRLLDNNVDRRRMAQAFATMDDWHRNFAAPLVRAIAGGGARVAERTISAGAGKRRIDRIRSLVSTVRLHARADLASAKDQRRTVGVALLGFLLAAMVLGVVGGHHAHSVLRRAVVKPMGRLVTVTERIRGGDLAARAEVRGATEVAIVTESLNEMAGEVQKVVQSLREVDELKTQFLSTVSHELRTPLTSINGYLQLLARGVAGSLTPEQMNYVQVAQRNSDRLTALIDDLLMLSRIDAGRVELRREPVDLSQQLRYLHEEMEPVAQKGATLLKLDAPGQLIVEGDARRLQQSFANLVSNAIKFNRAGGHVWMRALPQDGAAVIEVSDEGVGIPPAELQRVGERFFRASTTTDLPGTGLGLAITREIIERHGGKLEIESEVGKGSRVRITLPRQ